MDLGHILATLWGLQQAMFLRDRERSKGRINFERRRALVVDAVRRRVEQSEHSKLDCGVESEHSKLDCGMQGHGNECCVQYLHAKQETLSWRSNVED